MSTLSASVPVQLALADYMQQGGYDTHLRRLRRLLEQRQMAMFNAITQAFPASVSVSQPEGGYFLWLDLGEKVDAARVYQRALAQGVSIAPGTMFAVDDRYRHCIRINTSFEWGPPLVKAIQILATLVADELKS